MQEEKQNISPIKQRILQFAATLGISKREFYIKIGVSRGTLESKTGITEDILVKFIATYTNISIGWLITGEGNMLREEANSSSKDNSFLYKLYMEEKEENKKLIKEIGHLEERLEYYNSKSMGNSTFDALSDVPLKTGTE